MANGSFLKAFPMGVNTHQELVVYMREDCAICRAEGFDASSRVFVFMANGLLIELK